MNETLLFTGGSGFLGRNLLPLLRREYGRVVTLGLADADICVNLGREGPVLPEGIDVVFHAAGLAHVVPHTPAEERLFFEVNYDGTRNLCAALERSGIPRSLVYVSTVAVYGCDTGELIDESHPPEGSSPYARSKIMAEEFLQEWCGRHGVILTVLRPSLVAGVNPPGNLGDMLSGIRKGFYVNIAGGRARKSILMAEDLAKLLALTKDRGGVYNVCDSHHPSFGELSALMAAQTGHPRPVSIPYGIARVLARVGDILGPRFPINSARLDKLTLSLTFSNRKAIDTLGWTPLPVLENFKVV